MDSNFCITKKLYEAIKAQAEREGRSVSDYILNIHKKHLGCLGNNGWDEKEEKET